MNSTQHEVWRDTCRDVLAYVAALHRGDDEAAETMLDLGDTRDMLEALGLIYIATMMMGADTPEAVSRFFDAALVAVAPQVSTP